MEKTVHHQTSIENLLCDKHCTYKVEKQESLRQSSCSIGTYNLLVVKNLIFLPSAFSEYRTSVLERDPFSAAFRSCDSSWFEIPSPPIPGITMTKSRIFIINHGIVVKTLERKNSPTGIAKLGGYKFLVASFPM